MELHGGTLHSDDRLHAYGPLKRRRTALAAFLFLASTAAAGQSISVEVSPLRVEMQAAPGGSATQAVTLTNAGTAPVRIRARLSDWELSRDGAPQFESAPVGGPYSATDWVRIAPPELVLDPGKEGLVRFSLAVPASAEPAGYRTSILFEFLPVDAVAGGRGREVQFRSRVGTLIYVNVGKPAIQVDLIDLVTRAAKDQTHVVATLKNTSKATVRTKGTMTLFDAAGRTVVQTAVPDVPVLPESEREVAITAFEAAKPLPRGEYRIEVRIDVGMPAVIVGETTLKVDG